MQCVPQLWCGIRIGHYSLLKFTWQRSTGQLNSHHCLLAFGWPVRFLSSDRWLLCHKVQCLDLAQGHSGPCWHSSEQTAPICRAGYTAHHVCVCVCFSTSVKRLEKKLVFTSWVPAQIEESGWKDMRGYEQIKSLELVLKAGLVFIKSLLIRSLSRESWSNVMTSSSRFRARK